MIKSVIFDMDGTLLDSSYAMTLSVNHVRKFFDLEPITKEYLEYIINEPCEDLPMKLYGVKEYTLKHKEYFAEHYLANANLHVKPYDGVYEFLESLHVKGITLSIATNASDFFAKNMLEGQNISKFFSYIIGANNVEKSKPNPDMVDLILNKINVPKENTLFVGDSIKDELASFNANVNFAFVNWGYGKSKNAQNKFNNIDELQEYIVKNEN